MKPSVKEPALKKYQRLQVFLSHNGICSRRQAMEIIQSGQVKVNGVEIREPSTPIDPQKDKVEVKNRPVSQKSYEYVMLNKPKGYVTTTTDRYSEKTVMELLPPSLQHLNPVGRLDKDTEGLLLLTNDGDVAYRLTHPKFNIDKVYFVRINGELTGEQQRRLEKGVRIESHLTAPAKIRNLKSLAGKSEFDLTIHEGHKRQIRLMLEVVGHKVMSLKRIQQGILEIGSLSIGKFRNLNNDEILQLKKI